MLHDERELAFEIRQTELNDLAGDPRSRARKSWKRPASFALSLSGAAGSVLTAPIAAAIQVAGSLLGQEWRDEANAGVYSYLFNASRRF